MAAVWCDVYIGDKFEKKVKVKGPFEDFADLQEAVWNNRKASLHYCGAGDLDVYPSGTTLPPQDIQFFPSDSAFPTGVTSFIVVAPVVQQQQQQPPAESADVAQGTTSALERIEKKLDDMATIDVPMSEVTMNFTSSLLDALKIKYFVRKVNKEIREGRMKTYTWGEKEHEADGQPGCQQILEKEILPLDFDGDSLGIYDVRNRSLPELQAGKRKSNGYSDMAVGPIDSMAYAVTNAKDLVLSYAVALVELKTSRRDLKQGQLLLQLVSLALVSGTGQGVVVLGTDCDTKWRLLHFSNYNTVVVQPYEDGKKCIVDFKNLIVEGTARMQRNTAPEKLTRILEDDNADVNMNDFDLEEAERDRAIEREAKLQKLAGALGSLFGETLEVPSWAKASVTCPSYYM
mmetsp:Transcript_8052/g.12608  ORF Transcript_8052/g.12608 Transcript_8052/m.12608 type:complete len:402 (-) Transcript_8052:1315-2520(-)